MSGRVTLADVAAEAGVSVALVSIVMRGVPGASDATRERVRDVADRLGYRPDARARLLRSGRSRLLGVVFGVEYAYQGELVAGLYAAAEKLGYEIVLSATTPARDERAAVADLLNDRCEALVLIGSQPPSDLTGREDVPPVVVLAHASEVAGVDVVRTDDRAGLRLAVDHLVGLGHTRIAHVDGGRSPAAADRRRGYRAAMAAHGLRDAALVLPGGATEADGAAAAQALLAADVTAVTVFNDRCATGVLDAVRRAGRAVPEGLSVVGYDDDRLARLSHVDLTTVAQDTARMTELAVRRAVERIEGETVTEPDVVIPPRLVVRGTTTRR
ncbi:LacI family DNA-binding transcriptional regulator [Spongisporangium articulatum]|uniref:LacI family DNA-binding transcriptional regulator n=1 Tax=Spongisporangium articulatum TaxID=3362603 RepID=A0ABW8AU67_9ACTN